MLEIVADGSDGKIPVLVPRCAAAVRVDRPSPKASRDTSLTHELGREGHHTL
jgi:hypothetical protein